MRKVIVEMSGSNKEYNYPNNFPLPRIGEVIFVEPMEILCGRVEDIWYYPNSNKVKIKCKEFM